jgi:hypothetical protein
LPQKDDFADLLSESFRQFQKIFRKFWIVSEKGQKHVVKVYNDTEMTR